MFVFFYLLLNTDGYKIGKVYKQVSAIRERRTSI
jgi:hypothetical protein